jgi:Mg-chelatase subunit ChlI
MAEQTVTLYFNKISKAYISYRPGFSERHNAEQIIIRHETFDLDTHTWNGDYDTGSIIPIVEAKQNVYETQLQGRAQDKIFKKYKLSKQLNITTELMLVMMRKINEIAVLNGAEEITEENTPQLIALNEMRYYIDEILENNDRLTQAYIDSPAYDYISIREDLARQSRRLEGGLHELFPQEHSSDTV